MYGYIYQMYSTTGHPSAPPLAAMSNEKTFERKKIEEQSHLDKEA
jgi:hypothetical protein